MNSNMLALKKKAKEARKWKPLALLIMSFSFIFPQDSWQNTQGCKAMASD